MSQTFLIPIDDSDIALHPVAWLINNLTEWREAPKVHLLNVQATLPADVSRFINADSIREFHLENGMKAIAPARDQLAAAGVNAEIHVLIGHAAQTIADFAGKNACTQILLGTRAHTGFTGTLLGSVASKVIHLAGIPVTLVR
jgi:nucleotide-binding universal stress UspA family protein